ncbi:GTPase ObgE [Candidatus Marinamargulisbacteria bacterium SCGC AG-410-N11]|nr:GTPase ObgE [Candidatus Marinamargulisbacteria bacterium SCGC AG-410-N11]
MKFVDKVQITVQSGSGGNGLVSFRREKYIPKGGPDGGDGGIGGNIVFETNHNLQSLMDLKLKKKYQAKNGEDGKSKNKTGLNGKDTIIKVPVGTQIYDSNKTLIVDLNQNHQKYIAAKGGKGGHGNSKLATSVNRAPFHAKKGEKTSALELILELKLIAEIGLVGAPNAGKSTLLKVLTNSNPKINNYPFTTLFPNLGTLNLNYKEVIIADIPGIIEGASKGKGLGQDFLRHIDRTKYILHLVTIQENIKDTFLEYTTITKEIENYKLSNISQKKKLILLTKSDLYNNDHINKTSELFLKNNLQTISISSFNKKGITSLVEHIKKILI